MRRAVAGSSPVHPPSRSAVIATATSWIGSAACRAPASRRLACLLAAILVAAGARAGAQELDAAARARLERLITTRGFTRGLPRGAMPAPDGARVFFLRSGPRDNRQLLYVFDVATCATRVLVDPETLDSAAVISKEEQARRERQRQTERGITAFELSRDGRTILVPYSGDLFLVDVQRGAARRLTRTSAPELDPHLAPDGQRVAFVRGSDLVVLEVDGSGRETVVAHSDTAGVTYGQAEFAAQEEMHRSTGFWWAPDSRRLALTQVDARRVPLFEVPNFSDPGGAGSSDPYPKAGDPNAIVKLGVVEVSAPAAARATWFDLGDDFEYLARVDWAPDGTSLWVQTQPRSQKRLDVRCIDVRTGASRVVLREEDRDWVDLHDDFRPLADGRRFLWSSERTGHRHLEVWSASGRRERVLTSGDWDVVQVLDVDEPDGDVTFTGTRDGVLEQHLYRVPIGGGAVRRLSAEPGWHDATFNARGHAVYAESFSDASTQARLRVRRRDGKLLGELPSEALVPGPEDLEPRAEFLRLRAHGVPLDVQLVHPPVPAGKRLPLVVYVYAGPGSQQVRRSWPGERGLFDSWLAERGFAVARIDARGARARGHDSARIFARRLGDEELQDQADGVRALADSLPWIDPQRTGLWGWSYGGYTTVMALLRAPDVFRAGVAVAPVVDWRDYDTHYTERFLGLPAENAAGYDSSSVLPWVQGLRGHLTLVHGTGDDNVHFRESMLLVRELVKSGKQFDLMVYPGSHLIESVAERQHLYELVWRAFAKHL